MKLSAVEFPVSVELQKLITEIGRTDPHLRKTPVDDLISKATAIADKLKGHGLSQEKYDQFLRTMDTKADEGAARLFKYISDFALAGAGEKVVRESVADHIRKLAAAILAKAEEC